MPVEIMMTTGERKEEDKKFKKIEEAAGENPRLFLFSVFQQFAGKRCYLLLKTMRYHAA
jgi:hypothetical protein